jgi:hypothetical protein
MSWQYEIEFEIPRSISFGETEILQLNATAETKAQELCNAPGFHTLTARQTVAYAIRQSAIAAAALSKANLTEFPIGCKVRIRCSGHVDDDPLNYGPSHTHVEVVVIPYKISR